MPKKASEVLNAYFKAQEIELINKLREKAKAEKTSIHRIFGIK